MRSGGQLSVDGMSLVRRGIGMVLRYPAYVMRRGETTLYGDSLMNAEQTRLSYIK